MSWETEEANTLRGGDGILQYVEFDCLSLNDRITELGGLMVQTDLMRITIGAVICIQLENMNYVVCIMCFRTFLAQWSRND